MAKRTQKVTVRFSLDEYQLVVQQARTVKRSINAYITAACRAFVNELYDAARSDAVTKSQTDEIEKALAGATEQQTAAMERAVKQIDDAAESRDQLLRDDLRKTINAAMDRVGVAKDQLIPRRPKDAANANETEGNDND